MLTPTELAERLEQSATEIEYAAGTSGINRSLRDINEIAASLRACDLASEVKRLEAENETYRTKYVTRFAYETVSRHRDEYAAQLTASNAQITELEEKLSATPHSGNCKSRYVIDDTPWGTFVNPICRSINGCGHCEKCQWKQTRTSPAKHYPCDCWKSNIDVTIPAQEGEK